MIWKAIGQSVTGSSHHVSAKPCEDALQYLQITVGNDEVLICCASDGAGSAAHAGFAAAFTTRRVTDALSEIVLAGNEVTEADIYTIVESVYDCLHEEAEQNEVLLNEYSCTLLGCCITNRRAVFFQIGDGAIVRNDNNEFYTHIWWPENGEYQNSTSFLVDDSSLKNLNVAVIDDSVNEVALFTDGLQMLALNMDSQQVHQPFFVDLFKYLRMVDDESKQQVLNRKLAEYLDSKAINDRTDDDKTLFMATKNTPNP